MTVWALKLQAPFCNIKEAKTAMDCGNQTASWPKILNYEDSQNVFDTGLFSVAL